MSTHYEAPSELRGLEKLLRDFTYQNGFEISRVFNDFLTYIIHGFTLNAPPLQNWRYAKEQTAVFYLMYSEWVQIMHRQTLSHSWYDAFGELFMSLVVSASGQKFKGQFFTPPNICDLMSAISSDGNTLGPQKANDMACGSGRILLAHHARHPEDMLYAEDIDITCCMMTVCNFLIHGCDSIVICHDSLNPDSFTAGWRVNQILKYTGIPTIRNITEQEYRKIWGLNSKKEDNTDTSNHNEKPINK